MIFITVKDDIVTSQHFMPFDQKHGLGKTKEELLQEGFFVDTISPAQEIEGKVSILKHDGASLYYEYRDDLDEMSVLKNKLAEQELALIEIANLFSEMAGGL